MPPPPGLRIVGPPSPRPRATWSDGANLLAARLPEELVALLTDVGPGRLAGVFSIPDPASDELTRLQARVRGWHQLGRWSGLGDRAIEELVVFARDDRGAGLAAAPHGFLHLGAGGEVHDAGACLEELVDGFLCGSLHLVRERRIAGELDTFLELGVEATYVTASFGGLGAWLEALRHAGSAADDRLEDALSERPLLEAYTHALAALVGPEGDDVEPPVRAEALGSVVQLARRRAPALFGLRVPGSALGGGPLRDRDLRTWAEAVRAAPAPHLLGAEPPADAPSGRLPSPLRLPPAWRDVDPSTWIDATTARWASTALAATVDDVVRRVRAIDPPLARGALRQIDQLDAFRTFVTNGAKGRLTYDDPVARARIASERLATMRSAVLPVLALGALADREAISVGAVRLLMGVQDPDVAQLGLRLIVAGAPPQPRGADARTLAELAASAAFVGDDLADALIPALAEGSPIAAILLAPRVDRDDVLAALLDQLEHVIAAQGTTTPERMRGLVTGEDQRGVDALARHLGALGSVRRSLSEPGFRADGERRLVAADHFVENGLEEGLAPPMRYALTPPHRPGPLTPVGRALASRPERRVVAALAKLARRANAPIEARDEASKTLAAIGAPGADAAIEQVGRAWARWLRV